MQLDEIEACCNLWKRSIRRETDFREENQIQEAVAEDEGEDPQEEEDGKAVAARERREKIATNA